MFNNLAILQDRYNYYKNIINVVSICIYNAIVSKNFVYKYSLIAYKLTERHFHHLFNLNVKS